MSLLDFTEYLLQCNTQSNNDVAPSKYQIVSIKYERNNELLLC